MPEQRRAEVVILLKQEPQGILTDTTVTLSAATTGEIHIQEKGDQQIETRKAHLCFLVTTYELWTVLKLQA